MDVESFRGLLTPSGRAAISRAVTALDAGADAIAVATDVRRRFAELPVDVAAAAVTQATLRLRGRRKFGSAADLMWFTADGVEQATRAEVAAHRAGRFARLSASLGRPARVADLCCGIGADLRELASAGCEVTGFERDPLTCEAVWANVASLSLQNTSVKCLDVETLDMETLKSFDGVFIDPARRTDGRRTFDVRAYAPPWSFVVELFARHPAVAAKVAPGVPHGIVPADLEIEWVSYAGGLKEAVLWSGSLATPGVRHRATLLPSAATLCQSDDGPAGAGAPRRYLYEPDPAVVRAGLVAELAGLVDGVLLDPTTAYVTSDSHVATPFARAFEIDAVMPFSLKKLRAALRERQVGSVTIMKRGSAVDVERLRRDLRLDGDQHAVVVLALVGGRHHVLLAEPAERRDENARR